MDFAAREKCFPPAIEVRGARMNNLKNIDVDVPLNQFVCVCGVSGSGKSTLATDVLYAEGSRRYLQALSTYTRRRLGQTARPVVDAIRYLPSAVALRQRPAVPGVRSTVGTMSEVLNVLRLSFSRLGSHICPNGHRIPPTLEIAQLNRLTCPACGVAFAPLSAEDFAFNSRGACPDCHGTGEKEEINEAALIGDGNKTIDQGAVLGWRVPGSHLQAAAAKAWGIPTDIPYKDLTAAQKDFVLHGVKEEKVPVTFHLPDGRSHTMQVRYYNAADMVTQAFKKTDSEKSRAQLAARFFHIDKCHTCHGSRFAPKLMGTRLLDMNIAQVCALPLSELADFAARVPGSLPESLRPMAQKLMGELTDGIRPLLELGLSYLSLDRAGGTLSTGELQRIQLARTLKSETTGVLYVLDEPSIGLHPDNVEGLTHIFRRLLEQGNSLVVVDHDLDILKNADWLIEMGPGAGRAGGTVISQGLVRDVGSNKQSVVGGYLSGRETLVTRTHSQKKGKDIHISVGELYTLRDVEASIPLGKLTAVTGVSGSGKTTLILDCLIPAIQAKLKKQTIPGHVKAVEPAGIRHIVTIDAVPVGKNTRSTLATYSGIFDDIRTIFAGTPEARKRKWDAGHFSYNVESGACPGCGGTGQISLDIQYLPEMDMTCPTCHGRRYSGETLEVKWNGYSIADILELSVEDAVDVFRAYPAINGKLLSLNGLGLGYLKIGEPTPRLSGGEAQRLKLVTEMGKNQKGTLFVFDEPTTGLHPKDIRMLMRVFDSLIEAGGTVVVIEHDLDMIANADLVIDMGPGGGKHGGRIVARGTPAELCKNEDSLTGRYLKDYAGRFGLDW